MWPFDRFRCQRQLDVQHRLRSHPRDVPRAAITIALPDYAGLQKRIGDALDIAEKIVV
jgi:hypothetical protein